MNDYEHYTSLYTGIRNIAACVLVNNKIILVQNNIHLAFLSRSPVFSFLLRIKGNLLETTIMLALLLHADRLTQLFVTLGLVMFIVPFLNIQYSRPITAQLKRVR